MQIKTTMRYYLTLVRMAIIKFLHTIKSGEDTEESPFAWLLLLLLLLSRFSRVRLCATPQTAAHQAPPSLEFSRQEHWSGLGECKSIQPLWRIIWRFLLKKLGIKLPYDPAIPLLGIYPEKSTILKDTCTPAFTAAPFTIARTQKQPRCPLTDEWMKKLWYIYTMEYYSAIKRNEFESVLVRWMKLEPIIESEISQKEKNKHHALRHVNGIQKKVLMNLLAG